MNYPLPTLSGAARNRLLSLPREPLFIADWLGVVMIHLEVEPRALQTVTPFRLDLQDGRAFVSLVAFTLRGMRPRFGGRLGKILFSPLAKHRFLNVRTYVRHGNETGIHFLAEWLDSKLAVKLGPRVFGLPYRFGQIDYQNEVTDCRLHGRVVDARTEVVLEYRADSEIGVQTQRGLSQAAAGVIAMDPSNSTNPADEFRSLRVGTTRAPEFSPCVAGSLDEWLMERYTAFNSAGGRQRFFRVWHEPWLQRSIQVKLTERELLTRSWPFLHGAKLVGANLSPGVGGVWMGWPHRL